MIEFFNSEMTNAYHSFFLEKLVKRSSADKLWVKPQIKKVIRKHNRLHKSGKEEHWKKTKNIVVNKCKKAEKAYGEELSKIINSDSHTFHKTIQELTSPQCSTTYQIRTKQGIHITALI